MKLRPILLFFFAAAAQADDCPMQFAGLEKAGTTAAAEKPKLSLTNDLLSDFERKLNALSTASPGKITDALSNAGLDTNMIDRKLPFDLQLKQALAVASEKGKLKEFLGAYAGTNPSLQDVMKDSFAWDEWKMASDTDRTGLASYLRHELSNAEKSHELLRQNYLLGLDDLSKKRLELLGNSIMGSMNSDDFQSFLEQNNFPTNSLRWNDPLRPIVRDTVETYGIQGRLAGLENAFAAARPNQYEKYTNAVARLAAQPTAVPAVAVIGTGTSVKQTASLVNSFEAGIVNNSSGTASTRDLRNALLYSGVKTETLNPDLGYDLQLKQAFAQAAEQGKLKEFTTRYVNDTYGKLRDTLTSPAWAEWDSASPAARAALTEQLKADAEKAVASRDSLRQAFQTSLQAGQKARLGALAEKLSGGFTDEADVSSLLKSFDYPADSVNWNQPIRTVFDDVVNESARSAKLDALEQAVHSARPGLFPGH